MRSKCVFAAALCLFKDPVLFVPVPTLPTSFSFV